MRRRTTIERIPAAAISAAAFLLLLAPLTSAEVAQRHGVRVSVSGKIAPNTLPRSRTAPVAVTIGGRIASTGPGPEPQLKRMAFAINSNGHLLLRGLPVCRIGHIQPSTNQEAMAACGASLVGQGHFSADVRLPEQSPFPSVGKMLAFNGRLRGRPAILAHIYGTTPAPTSYVLPFLIKKAHGTYTARSSKPTCPRSPANGATSPR